MATINDPNSNVSARVTIRGIATDARSADEKAVMGGVAYSIPIAATTPSGAANFFFYLENRSTTAGLCIPRIRMRAASAEVISIYVGQVPVSPSADIPTEITVVGRNSTSTSPTGEIFAVRDADLATVEAAGGGGILGYLSCATAAVDFLWEDPIILRPNGTLALLAAAGSIALSGTVTAFRCSAFDDTYVG